MKQLLLIALIMDTLPNGTAQEYKAANSKDDRNIRPWSEDPRYWQYKGNYVRNTISQREALTLKPYALKNDGTFDLDIWNEDYWSRFEDFLERTDERDIIVQIEVWDRFDYSRDFWETSPWNPKLNCNYSYEGTGFDETYPEHPPSKVPSI